MVFTSNLEWSHVQTAHEVIDVHICYTLQVISQRIDFTTHSSHFVYSNQVFKKRINALMPTYSTHGIQLSSNFVTYTHRGHSFSSHLCIPIDKNSLPYLTQPRGLMVLKLIFRPLSTIREQFWMFFDTKFSAHLLDSIMKFFGQGPVFK